MPYLRRLLMLKFVLPQPSSQLQMQRTSCGTRSSTWYVSYADKKGLHPAHACSL